MPSSIRPEQGPYWRWLRRLLLAVPGLRQRGGVYGGGSGQDEVHGSIAPWVAWSADFAAGPGVSGPATIVIRAPDAYAAGEPWFVRVLSYPGLGSALAWDRAVSLPAGGVLSRRFDVAVADGRLTEAETRNLAAEVTASRADAG